jgi:hypothetical protein
VSSRHIAALVEAVADGEVVDWQAVRVRLPAPDDSSIAAELQTLSGLSSVSQRQATVPERRLPLALELGRGLAIACAVVGGATEIVGAAFFGRTGHVIFAMVLSAFAAAALYLDLGGRDRRTRALATCYWMVAASFSASAFRWLTLEAGDPRWLQILTSIRPESLFAASLWQFAREFPTVTRFGRLDRICLAALRITSLAGIALLCTNIAIALAPLSRFATLAAPFNGVTAQPWFWNIVFGAAFPALVTIGLRARHAESDEERRARRFLYAIFFSFAPLVLDVLAEGLFPAFRRVVRTPQGQLIGGLIIYPLQLALPLVTAYAVVVNNVLNVRVLVQRGLRYLLAKALIGWGAAVPFAALLLFVYRHRDQPLTVVLASSEARVLMWLGGVAILVLLARPWLVRALDRWALPGLEDGPTTLERMTDMLKDTRTPVEVVSVFAEATERALQAPTEGYVTRDGVLVPLRLAANHMPKDSLIPVLLEGARLPCVVGPDSRGSFYGLMTDQDRRWIAEEQIAVLVPVISGRGRGGLVGMIALRNRRNALTFSPNDIRFLRASAASVSLASDLLEAESQPPVADSIAELDELAIECSQCGRVLAWTEGGSECGCGGSWRRAALPRQVGQRFNLTRLLGAGGMGIVYHATDVTLQRDVAIKTLTRVSAEAAERLIVEARTMAALSHPNIAVLYGAEIWRGTPILVMEYLAGGTLAARLRGQPLPLRQALELMISLGSTLEHLHGIGRYHGDIKPSNIGFTAVGTAKFLDFGLSRAIVDTASDRDEHGHAPRVFAGTLPYLSPEVREGTQPGPGLDVWALTIVMCECLTGRHPIGGAANADQIASGIDRMLQGLQASQAAFLCDFLSGALSIAVESRHPATAHDFVARLQVHAGKAN